MPARKFREVSDHDHVLSWIGILEEGAKPPGWPSPSVPISGLMNLSDYADAITEADAARLRKVLASDAILKDDDVMQMVVGIRRDNPKDYPESHWWWWPEKL